MQSIAILGPEGTLSDKAATEYLKKAGKEMKRAYYPTIEKAFHAVGRTCHYGIIPIENTLDGYVQRTLDLLMEMQVSIIKEVTIPVQFGFIGNIREMSQAATLYVQFKAKGQCREFIDTLQNISMITTESNMESFDQLQAGREGECAIVPYHLAETVKNKYIIPNVTDSDNNFTRFIIVAGADASHNWAERYVREYLAGYERTRVSFFVTPFEDRPGVLFEILRGFGEKKINLVSIMSRPTKEGMGAYHFYLEIDESVDKLDIILGTLKNIEREYSIKVCGVYG